MAAGVFCGAQPDSDSVRQGLSRGSGRRRCSLGGMVPAGNTILPARDGIPVSGNYHIPLVRMLMTQTHFSFPWRPGRYVHGTRVVCPILQPSGESPIVVRGFNSHASRTPTMAKTLAGTRLGIDPEQPPEVHASCANLPCFPQAWYRQGSRHVAAALLCVGSGTVQAVGRMHDDWMVRTYAVAHVVNANEVANKEIPCVGVA